MDGRTQTPRTDGAIIKLVNLAASATSLDEREGGNERKSERTRVEEEAGMGAAGAMPDAAVIRLRGCES